VSYTTLGRLHSLSLKVPSHLLLLLLLLSGAERKALYESKDIMEEPLDQETLERLSNAFAS
jgi:hypothetical protein